MTVLCIISDYKGQDYHYNYYNLTLSEMLILFHEKQLKEWELRLHEFRVELIKLQFHHKMHTGKDANLLSNFDNKMTGSKGQDHLSKMASLKKAGFQIATDNSNG